MVYPPVRTASGPSAVASAPTWLGAGIVGRRRQVENLLRDPRETSDD